MAVLVNYEMFILAAACLVFIIITAAFSFSKVKDAYRKKWINRNPVI